MKETPKYAEGTKVPIERSKAELETLLGKHGAARRALMHDDERRVGAVAFELAGRRYRIEVPMPPLLTPAEMLKSRTVAPARWWERGDKWRLEYCKAAHDQGCREQWRALVLLIKAKLEIVRQGASTFEREFLADLVLPNNQTAGQVLGDYMKKLVAEGYTGLPALPPGRPDHA